MCDKLIVMQINAGFISARHYHASTSGTLSLQPHRAESHVMSIRQPLMRQLVLAKSTLIRADETSNSALSP